MDINEESSQEGSESFKEHNDHDSRILEDSKAELLSYIEEDNQDLPVKSVTHELACALPLMAELLEGLEGKNGLTAGAPYLVCILHMLGFLTIFFNNSKISFWFNPCSRIPDQKKERNIILGGNKLLSWVLEFLIMKIPLNLWELEHPARMRYMFDWLVLVIIK